MLNSILYQRLQRFWQPLVLTVLLLGSSLLSGCAPSHLLGSVTITPSGGVFYPNFRPADEERPHVATLDYTLNAEASITLAVRDAKNRMYYLRGDAKHGLAVLPDTYEILFNGTVPVTINGLPGKKMLSDGTYSLILTATGVGKAETQERPMTIKNADTTLLKITEFSIDHPRFAPQGCRVIDSGVTHISYTLSKTAAVSIYVVGKDKQRHNIAIPPGQLEKASTYSQTWDGSSGGPILPDDTYTWYVEAQDALGNLTRVKGQVQLMDAGEAKAEIVRAVFSPHATADGNILKVTVTVKNTGKVPLEPNTRGPFSGYEYLMSDTFGFTGPKQSQHYLEEPDGKWRVGVDWDVSKFSSAPYPLRWSFRQPLQPGQEVDIVGLIRVSPQNDQPFIHFWTGLVQEGCGFPVDRHAITQISIALAPHQNPFPTPVPVH